MLFVELMDIENLATGCLAFHGVADLFMRFLWGATLIIFGAVIFSSKAADLVIDHVRRTIFAYIK